MVREFGIVVDSTTQTGFKQKIFKDASVVSLSFIIGDMTIVDLKYSNRELFNFSNGKDIKLLNPTPEQFIKAFDEQKALGYEKVVYLASAQVLNECYRNARLAQTILNDPNIFIIDTKTFGPGIVRLLELMDFYHQNDLRINDILKNLTKSIEESEIYFTTPHLKPFVEQRETNKFKDTLVKIMPFTYIIAMKQGQFRLVKRVVGNQGVEAFFIEKTKQRMQFELQPYTQVFHTTLVAKAKELQHELHHNFPEATALLYGELSFSIAKDLGMKSIGIYLSDNEV